MNNLLFLDTTESGQPPRYPLNVESAEAQAHESKL